MPSVSNSHSKEVSTRTEAPRTSTVGVVPKQMSSGSMSVESSARKSPKIKDVRRSKIDSSAFGSSTSKIRLRSPVIFAMALICFSFLPIDRPKILVLFVSRIVVAISSEGFRSLDCRIPSVIYSTEVLRSPLCSSTQSLTCVRAVSEQVNPLERSCLRRRIPSSISVMFPVGSIITLGSFPSDLQRNITIPIRIPFVSSVS
mmetsp:Transcript_947/g.1876  ORF Transcript_947/g.1876 Transcript_947/m.1876 type:complete len:201 (-) Transcript_947:325-927(-)